MGTNGKLFQKLQAKVDKIIAEHGEQTVWLVLEGDWGGQIYLTVPWQFVGRRARIKTLLTKFDRLAWGCNGGDGSSAYIYRKDESHLEMEREAGCLCGVSGGMGGGGLFEDTPWMHDEFYGQSISLAQEVLDDLRGVTTADIAAMDFANVVATLLDLQPLSRSV